MSLDPIADPGYESDTGERDNPTCANFEANQPVQQVIGFFPGKKALNRKGRAICRIMAAHGWAHKDIATIFHISAWSVSRAITNVRYTPRDRIEEDYARVDSEFLEKYPPIPQYNAPKSSAVIYIDTSDDENDPQAHGVGFGDEGPSSSARPQRTAKVLCRSLIKDLADDEDDGPVWNPLIDLEEPDVPTTSQKRIHEHSSAPVTSNPNGGVQTSSTGSPLKRARYGDHDSGGRSQAGITTPLSAPGSLLGSTPSIFRFLPPSIQTAPANVGIGIPASLAHTLAQGQGSSPPLPPPPTRPFPLPIPTNNLVDAAAQRTTPRELEAFLKTLTNINFSSYSELFTIQGFTIPRLQTLATWSRDEIQETLDCLLMGSGAAAIGQRGMTAVISINFEIAIRNLKSSPPPSAPLPRSLLPPLGSNATNSGTTLSVFLRNVMGFDLSAHSQLMEDQGFSVGTLSGMPAWERARLQEVLRRALLKPTTEAERKMSRLPEGKKGLSGLEVLALEFCIRRARKED